MSLLLTSEKNSSVALAQIKRYCENEGSRSFACLASVVVVRTEGTSDIVDFSLGS